MTDPQNLILDTAGLHGFYTTYFNYYRTLNADYRDLFIERCLQFISEKRITGAEGFVPDERVRAIIAASAVQLTLGLETWNLDYFETIVLHPSDFDSKTSALKFRGETNLAGFIRFSWKGFLKGYQIADDNINLGLHEFSHALRFNSIKGNEQDYFIEHYFPGWLASAYEAFYDLKNNRASVFRTYGGANINEFVSVCIEHYFESPQEIKDQYPLLYYSTAALLNQQTENGKTRLNIRNEMLEEKDKLLPGFQEEVFFNAYRKTPLMVCIFSFIFGAFIGSKIDDLFNPFCICFYIIALLAWLRVDSTFIKVWVHGKHFSIQKGLLIFRWREKTTLPVSHLISVRGMSDDIIKDAWELVYYNSENEFFYEEELTAHNMNQREFLKSLSLNKIMHFK